MLIEHLLGQGGRELSPHLRGAISSSEQPKTQGLSLCPFCRWGNRFREVRHLPKIIH